MLQAHPEVADAATIGVPNDEWGEEVLSLVELREGSVPSEPLAEAILDHVRERLARYKCPRRIEFADELPRHENGKIYRRRVRDGYWQGRERRI